MRSTPIPQTDRFAQLFKPVIFTFFALYLVGCFSPLRLEYDSVRYFAIKDCLETGCGVNSRAATDFLPKGYPVLLWALSKIGLLNAFVIAFINGVYLLCSLWLTRKMMGDINPLVFYSVVLLNWTFIKLFAYPLSEMQYLFFSTVSVYCFTRFTKDKRWGMLLVSFLSAALATFTRTVGLALVVALVIALIWQHRKLVANRAILWVGIALVISIMIFMMFALPGLKHYLSALVKGSPNDPGMIMLIGAHIKEWGQLLLNMPIRKMESFMPTTGVDIIFLLAGGLLMAWFIYALFKNRRTMPPVILIYLVIYTVTIFKWPHIDPRFWTPVLPLVAACILQAPLRRGKFIFTVVFFAYMLMGIIAFAYSFYTQFNRAAFARNQANGKFRNEYEMYFFGKTLSDTSTRIDAEVLGLLKKYD